MEFKNVLPMNLQFFAEDAPAEQPKEESKEMPKEQPKEQPKEETKSEPKDDKTLNEQLQSALVEIARLKRAVDKSTGEASEYKKKWKESLSEQEQASMEKAEAQAKRDEEFENMKKTIRINELTENFMDLGYSKEMAKKAATAQAENDTESLLTIQKQFQESQKKKWETEFLASRPELKTGVGETQTISKEQFDKMSLIEKTKLKRENEAEYNRLVAL